MATDHEEFLRVTMGSMELVYNLSRRLTHDPRDAEDLVQDTFLAAYKAWVEHRRPREVAPWIATICLNLGRSRFRTKARRPLEVPLEERPVEPRSTIDPEAEAIAAVERDVLYRAMEDLPEEQRVAITLVDLSGMSTHEAASVMGTPRGTVLSRLHRGRRALARLLGDRIDQEETR
jgi:RNA polymerase sigma-70 factor, ECF subfamily